MIRISKEHVQEKTAHDQKVINLTKKYSEGRERFQDEQGEFVWQVLLNGREHLQQNFSMLSDNADKIFTNAAVTR
jgi:hypothetical protein